MSNNVLDSPVLVLNKSWMAVRVQSLKKALSKVTAGRAKILDPISSQLYTWEDWLSTFFTEKETEVNYETIRSKYWSFKKPKIIICTSYNKIPHTSLKLSRRNILIRDRFTCQYTGKRVTYKNATLDHIVPKSKGGKTSWTNLVACTFEVNVKKADRTPEEAGLKLIHVPKKPQWSPIYAISLKKRPKCWENYIKEENMENIEQHEMEENID